jgi:hypothetical protein
VNATAPLIDELWLATLQRITTRVAHEIKGALNGVAVNLEVVRSRAEKPDLSASALGRYATAATDQLGVVIAMTEAVLSLARPVAEPVEIAGLVRRFDALLAPAARTDDRELELVEPIDVVGATSAPGSGVRLAIGAALLAAIEQSTRVTCRGDTNSEPRLCIEALDGVELTIDQAVVSAAADVGIRIHAEKSGITIAFPAVAARGRVTETS